MIIPSMSDDQITLSYKMYLMGYLGRDNSEIVDLIPLAAFALGHNDMGCKLRSRSELFEALVNLFSDPVEQTQSSVAENASQAKPG